MSLYDDWRPRVPDAERCPECNSPKARRPALAYRPSRIRNRKDVHDFVRSLGDEGLEWLIALYLDSGLDLISVETIAQGEVDWVPVDKCRIILRGVQLGAAGFVLVHNHPSGKAVPSKQDWRTMQSLRRLSEDYDCVLFDAFVIGGIDMTAIELF